MQAAIAPRGDEHTFLTHFVGSGLDDDLYVVENFRSLVNRDFVPIHADGAKPNGRHKAHSKIMPLKAGRENAAYPRRDYHRDREQAARLWRAAAGLAQHGTLRRPPPERLTGALRRDVLPVRRQLGARRPLHHSAPEQQMAYRNVETRKLRDCERFRKI